MMTRPKTETDILLMELISFPEGEYRLLYFELGSEWQVRNAGKWPLWGDQLWESWWADAWQEATGRFIAQLRMDDALEPYFYIREEDMRCSDKRILRSAYAKLMYREMLTCPANQAVMELSMHRAIKKLNRTKP